jgi:tetratricopeptide (TPR) repeat protein/serine/threonine protein kinase
MTERDLFIAALQKEGPAQRQAYLDEACAGRPGLRQQVEDLLRLHEQAGSFLQGPAPAPATGALAPAPAESAAAAERPGAVIGPYKLLQQIGAGGMGTVFMAEQTQPVQRRVALKLVKPGMDSRQVIARFEAERQALALMDHPNIARVLDAGATPGGHPYFVMELVKGVPLTTYCDQRRLTPRQRLQLFVPVCQAVQHAHTKGIIHRDLKPSNVLVAQYDGLPVPKVIDFGVAKATGQRLTERTLFTEFGAIVGTLEYMSPEQAQLNQLDIDTRSDIYSLGVLLYELLTGTTPLERKRLPDPALLEVLRLIREEEPPRPSARLSTTEELPAIAAKRGLEPRKLSGLVRGELDWIVMKCLEKDRSRRYETASGLALDLERYLADEPVLACPPSTAYRIGKFTRRHKGALLMAGLAAVLLLVTVGVVAASLVWVGHDRAVRQASQEQAVQSALAEVASLYRRDQVPAARAAVTQTEHLLSSGGGREELHERARRWRTDLDQVARLEEIRLQRPVDEDEPRKLVETDRSYRRAFRRYDLDVEALDPDEAARRIRASAIRDRLLAALTDWSLLKMKVKQPRGARDLLNLMWRADRDPWRGRLRQILLRGDVKALKGLARDRDLLRQPPVTVLFVGMALRAAREYALTTEVLRRGQRRYPHEFWLNYHLAQHLLFLKPHRAGEAVGFFRVALALRPNSFILHFWLGRALGRQGLPAEAEAEYRAALRLNPNHAGSRNNLGIALYHQGRPAEAEDEYRAALRLDPKLSQAHDNLGVVLADKGKLAEAEAAHRQALRLDPNCAMALSNLGVVLAARGKPAEAEAAHCQALRLDPNHGLAHSNLGLVLEKRGDVRGAEAEFREAIRVEPDLPYPYNHLGTLLRTHKRDLDGALAAYRQAIRLKPGYANAHLNLGITLYAQGKLPQADAAWRQAIRLKPTLAAAHNNLAVSLTKQGKWPQAAAAWRKVVALQPDNAPAHLSLGQLLSLQRKYREAADAFRTALRLQPNSADAHVALGYVLYKLGRGTEAVAEHRAALRLQPDHGLAHHYLGVTLDELNRPAEAIAAYKEAARCIPDHVFTHRSLAWLLATCPEVKLRDPGRALEAARKAVALTPGEFHSWKVLGMARYRVGDWKGSIEATEKSIALRKGPFRGDPWQWFLLAMAHWQLGNKDQARRRYDQAVRWMDRHAPNDEELRHFRTEAAALLKGGGAKTKPESK